MKCAANLVTGLSNLNFFKNFNHDIAIGDVNTEMLNGIIQVKKHRQKLRKKETMTVQLTCNGRGIGW